MCFWLGLGIKRALQGDLVIPHTVEEGCLSPTPLHAGREWGKDTPTSTEGLGIGNRSRWIVWGKSSENRFSDEHLEFAPVCSSKGYKHVVGNKT